MKKYKVYVETVLYETVTVEAESLQDAQLDAEDEVFYDLKKRYPELSFGSPVARETTVLPPSEEPPKVRKRRAKKA